MVLCNSQRISLSSILYVPNLDCNLLSISKLTHDLNCAAKFFPNLCEFQALDSRKKIGSAEMCFCLKGDSPLQRQVPVASCSYLKSQSNFNSLSNKDEVMLWHYRLSDLNFIYLENSFPGLFINKSLNSYHCKICQLFKHTRNIYPSIPYKSSHPFSMIHHNVCEPTRVKNIIGSRWFVSFIDDHTRTTWIFLMKEKSEVRRIFQSFNSMITTQFHTKIHILKIDNAREYFNSLLRTYFLDQGIVHLSSCVDTPQKNGVEERKNIHLLEVARSLLFSNHVPKIFWGEAILTATYLINRMPIRVLKFHTP